MVQSPYCVVLHSSSQDLEKDSFLQRKLDSGQLIRENTSKVLLGSHKADVIDYFRTRYRKLVDYILIKDEKNTLKEGKYSNIQSVELDLETQRSLSSLYYVVPSSKSFSLIARNFKLLIKPKDKQQVQIYRTKELNPIETKDSLQSNLHGYVRKGSFPSDFLYLPKYLALENALNRVYRKVVLPQQVMPVRFAQLIPVQEAIDVGQANTVLENFFFVPTIKDDLRDLKIKSALQGHLDPLEFTSRSTGCHYFFNYCACQGLWAAIKNTNFQEPVTFYDHETVTLRNEKGKIHSLERLEVFKRNQIVFLGSSDQVASVIEDLLDRFKKFFSTLRIPVRFVKKESWFAEESSKEIYTIDFYTQGPLRTSELQLGNLSNNSDHWTSRFNVKYLGQKAHNGCTGVGLQRLIYVFLYYNGFDQSTWPQEIRLAYEQSLSLFKVKDLQ